MRCANCGKEIDDARTICPECGYNIDGNSENKISREEPKHIRVSVNKFPFILSIIIALFSLITLSLDYFVVEIQFMSASSTRNISGYGFISALAGSGRLTGIMVIILITVNILNIITSVLVLIGSLEILKVKKIMMVEAVLYILSSTISLIHISTVLLNSFKDTIGYPSVGVGCYLNLAASICFLFVFILAFHSRKRA